MILQSLLLYFWFSFNYKYSYYRYNRGGLLRALGFVRFILLILAIQYVLNIGGSVYRDKIFKIWFLVFLIVSFDLIYEFFMGQNILGFSADPLLRKISWISKRRIKNRRILLWLYNFGGNIYLFKKI